MVFNRPGNSGGLFCLRSSAWIWLFSSQDNTSAWSGGFKYSPTTSNSFSAKWGPFEINIRVFMRGRITGAFRTYHELAVKMGESLEMSQFIPVHQA